MLVGFNFMEVYVCKNVIVSIAVSGYFQKIGLW